MEIVSTSDIYDRKFATCIQIFNNNNTGPTFQEYAIQGLEQGEINITGIKKAQK